jgi:hypothetical protein
VHEDRPGARIAEEQGAEYEAGVERQPFAAYGGNGRVLVAGEGDRGKPIVARVGGCREIR